MLTQNICGPVGVTVCPGPNVTVSHGGPQPFTGTPFIGPTAPAGTNLPVTPKFKANAVVRYEFDELAGWKPYGQISYVYQTKTSPLLLLNQLQNVGMQPSYGMMDMAVGGSRDKTTIQLFVTNVTDKRAQLTRFNQTNPSIDNQTYIIPSQPRTIALKFGQKF